MKVVVLNYPGTYIEISDVPMDIAKKLEDGIITDEEALILMDYDTDGIHWMFTDDEIPVFWKNEVVPYVTL